MARKNETLKDFQTMMDWQAKKQHEEDERRRNEEQYYAQCAKNTDVKRREKEDALAEYFRQLANQQEDKYKMYLNNVTLPEN